MSYLDVDITPNSRLAEIEISDRGVLAARYDGGRERQSQLLDTPAARLRFGD